MFEGRDVNPRRSHPEASVVRLCETYDALLDHECVAATAAPGPDLSALAQIYDIPVDRTAAEVWSDLRAFLVRQPVRIDEASDESRPATAVSNDVRLTILVVEDDADMAEDLVSVLTEAGHRVVGPFHSAEAAEVSAALHPIDLALLDINLSGVGTGVDLAQSLRTRWGVESVFLSGDVTAAARHARLAQAILVKPYRARDVLDAVGRIVSAM